MMAEPRVIFSSPEECKVLMRGWVVIGVSRKSLEEELTWQDVNIRIDWKAFESKPQKLNARMLSDSEKHRARKRLFVVMKEARAVALKKSRQLELFESRD